MSNPNSPENLAARIAQIERQLRTLATAPRAGHTALETGVFEVLDADGDTRVRIGDLTDAGNYGVEIFDDNNGRRFRVDIDGMKDPYLALPWVDRQAGIIFGPDGYGQYFPDTGFYEIWACDSSLVSHKGCLTGVQLVVEEDTIGELRLSVTGPLGEYFATDTVEVVGLGARYIEFQWLHGMPLGTNAALFRIEARRSSGTGDMTIFPPQRSFQFCDPDICTAGGVYTPPP